MIMTEPVQTNVLLIGMSKTGKTHFGGQLYGRLSEGELPFRLDSTPDDISLFSNIWGRLNEGLEGDHTPANLYKTITLPILNASGQVVNLSYPDYGGEQVARMVKLREVDASWQEQIERSNHWFLFIRPDLLEQIEDVTTRFHSMIGKASEEKIQDSTVEMSPYSAVFHVELLQILLSAKGVPLISVAKPRLTILLSCWDKVKNKKGIVPESILKDRMPLLHQFINAVWTTERPLIYGLSSLGRDLKAGEPDEDFADEGPENFGYLILPNGEKEPDLTQLLTTLFQ